MLRFALLALKTTQFEYEAPKASDEVATMPNGVEMAFDALACHHEKQLKRLLSASDY